jgi:RNA polymerase sigma-70 factor (ECF subfamily)
MLRGLVEAARGGDRVAFEEIAAQQLDRCYATAVWILRDESAAQDAVQEAMIRAWRDLPRLRDSTRFDAWLRRLLVRACYDEARRAGRHRRTQLAVSRSDDRVQADAADAIAQRDEIERVLALLSPAHRAAVVLRHALDLSVPEVADAMGVPLGTAKSRLHHAERALRLAIHPADGSVIGRACGGDRG